MQIRDYGLWDSPITAEMLTASGTSLSFIQYDRELLYWVEQRPTENGRSVLCKYVDGAAADVIPSEYNVRSRVHEYGGIAFAVKDGRVVFVNFKDQCLYAGSGDDFRRVTKPGTKLADPVFLSTNEIISVAEVEGKPEPKNFIATVSLTDGRITPIVEGADFYSSPAVSANRRRLCWLSWDHPNMPWQSTELWVADLDTGGISNRIKVYGGSDEAVFQPQWMPSGELLFSAEPEGWWNLQLWNGDAVKPVHTAEAEFGAPNWIFGMSTTAICSRGIAGVCGREGLSYLVLIDPESGVARELDLPFSSISQLRSDGDKLSFFGSSPTQPRCLVTLDLKSEEWEIVRNSATGEVPQRCISEGNPISFPTTDGETAYAMLYLPANDQFSAPEGRLPPLIVKSHGGPTGATTNGLSLRTLFWTSRGFAVVDVNYRGSTGFGKKYRESLNGKWGVADVDDCCAAVEHLVARGAVDPRRLAITGGSAGGYTTLASLAFRDVFSVGASYFGVSDLGALAEDTHKFESRYLDSLVGPWPEAKVVFEARSPLHHLDGFSCPVIFFQGAEDKVVPPNQARLMVDALKSKGVDVEYAEYPGEQHGFRKAENIMDAIEKELAFYLKTWGMSRS